MRANLSNENTRLLFSRKQLTLCRCYWFQRFSRGYRGPLPVAGGVPIRANLSDIGSVPGSDALVAPAFGRTGLTPCSGHEVFGD